MPNMTGLLGLTCPNHVIAIFQLRGMYVINILDSGDIDLVFLDKQSEHDIEGFAKVPMAVTEDGCRSILERCSPCSSLAEETIKE